MDQPGGVCIAGEVTASISLGCVLFRSWCSFPWSNLTDLQTVLFKFFTPYCIQQYLSSAFETKLLESFVKIMGVSLPLVTTDMHVLSCQEGKKSCFLAMKVAWL